MEGPGHEAPGRGHHDQQRPRRAPAPAPPQRRQRQPQSQQVQGPPLRVVQLEQAPVGARREQQEVRGAVGPPLAHRSRAFTSAAMRWRSAASGMGPRAAPRFCSTWSTRVVAGMAQLTAGCDTTNFSAACAQLSQQSSAAQAGSGWRCQCVEQRTLAERAVHDDADAPLLRQRQQALLDIAVQQVVGELHEVDGLRAHDAFDVRMAPALGRGDADVAQPSGGPSSAAAWAGAPPRPAGCAPAAGQSAARPTAGARPRPAPAHARRATPRPCRPRTPAHRAAASGHGRWWPGPSHTSARSRSCRPPAPKKARITAVQAARACGSGPTLKVIQLPRPTRGKASPPDGKGRANSGTASAGQAARAGSAASVRSACRRPAGAHQPPAGAQRPPSALSSVTRLACSVWRRLTSACCALANWRWASSSSSWLLPPRR